MKEIIAIIRPNKVKNTKEALDAIGFPGMTVTPVLGRGKQRGIAGECSFNVSPELLAKGNSAGMKYIPKRMVSIMASDADVDAVVEAIVKVNQTPQIGDGRVFVCPIERAVRVRTGETGDEAVK